MTAEAMRDLLVRTRFWWDTEYDLQDSIGMVLHNAGYEIEREVSLGPAGRIDFLIAGQVGLEVKVKGSLAQLLRQLRRYAGHPDIQALIVASTVARHRTLPTTIADVPVYVAPLYGDLL